MNLDHIKELVLETLRRYEQNAPCAPAADVHWTTFARAMGARMTGCNCPAKMRGRIASKLFFWLAEMGLKMQFLPRGVVRFQRATVPNELVRAVEGIRGFRIPHGCPWRYLDGPGFSESNRYSVFCRSCDTSEPAKFSQYTRALAPAAGTLDRTEVMVVPLQTASHNRYLWRRVV